MEHTVTAASRTGKGRGAVRRLRAAGKVPGIVYGSNDAPQAIVLDHHRLQLDLEHEAFHSTVLNLEIDGRKQPALLREVQSHPVNGKILHVDFQAVAADVEIAATVTIHYHHAENSPGVKLNHGIFSATTTELHVHCLPKDLPESLDVDVGHLEINQTLHLKDITVPAGVRLDALIRGENPSLATILPPAAEEEKVDDAELAEDTIGEDSDPSSQEPDSA